MIVLCPLTIAHLKANVDVIGGQGGGFEVLCIRLSHCGVVHDTSIGGMDGRLTLGDIHHIAYHVTYHMTSTNA